MKKSTSKSFIMFFGFGTAAIVMITSTIFYIKKSKKIENSNQNSTKVLIEEGNVEEATDEKDQNNNNNNNNNNDKNSNIDQNPNCIQLYPSFCSVIEKQSIDSNFKLNIGDYVYILYSKGSSKGRKMLSFGIIVSNPIVDNITGLSSYYVKGNTGRVKKQKSYNLLILVKLPQVKTDLLQQQKCDVSEFLNKQADNSKQLKESEEKKYITEKINSNYNNNINSNCISHSHSNSHSNSIDYDKKIIPPILVSETTDHYRRAGLIHSEAFFGNMNVIEIGCDVGDGCFYIHNQCKNVYGIDLSKISIEKSIEKYDHLQNVSFHRFDCLWNNGQNLIEFINNDIKLDPFSYIILIDINGNRALPAVEKMLQIVIDRLQPVLIVVKSVELYKKINIIQN